MIGEVSDANAMQSLTIKTWDMLHNQVLQSQQFKRCFAGTFDAFADIISASCVCSAFVCM